MSLICSTWLQPGLVFGKQQQPSDGALGKGWHPSLGSAQGSLQTVSSKVSLVFAFPPHHQDCSSVDMASPWALFPRHCLPYISRKPRRENGS